MLRIIDLYTINKIFSASAVKLSINARGLYIHCLLYHFGPLTATTQNAFAFSMPKSFFGDYSKYDGVFKEMAMGGMVIIEEDYIYFENVWGRHINRDLLLKPTIEAAVGQNSL